MTTGKKIILALAVIVILIGAWFVAYHNHKSTSNLPQLSEIALMDEADVNELLVGYYRTQLPDVWGGPDPELSGENTWVWVIDEHTLLSTVQGTHHLRHGRTRRRANRLRLKLQNLSVIARRAK